MNSDSAAKQGEKKVPSELTALREWERAIGESATASEGNAFIDGFYAGQAHAHAASQAEREFCEGCDHGVVAGEVCALCGGSGYKERRVAASQVAPPTQDSTGPQEKK